MPTFENFMKNYRKQMAESDATIASQAAQIERFKAELKYLAAFADIRSKDESKTFVKVNRGALRTIAQRCYAALQPKEGE